MESAVLDAGLRILIVLALVFANGFFVAAEFSLVTVRKTRVDQLIAEGNRMAVTVRPGKAPPTVLQWRLLVLPFSRGLLRRLKLSGNRCGASDGRMCCTALYSFR